MEEAKYIKVIDILTEKIKSLELDNACKGYEIDKLKQKLETAVEQAEVFAAPVVEMAVNVEEKEIR